MAEPYPGVYGTRAKFGIVVGPDFPVTSKLDFMGEALQMEASLVDTSGLRGTRSHDIQRTREGRRLCRGTFEITPTAAEARLLLPWILGGAETGSNPYTFPLAEELIPAQIMVYKGVDTFKYPNVKVDKCTVVGESGQPMKWILELIGTDEVKESGDTFPDLDIDRTSQIFMYQDSTIDINGTTVRSKRSSVVIDNFIDKERYLNSINLVSTFSQDRRITYELELPYATSFALYGLPITIGYPGFLNFTYGDQAINYSFGNLSFAQNSPRIKDRTEIMLPMNGLALRNGDDLEMEVEVTIP